jgi:hypothetical protein
LFTFSLVRHCSRSETERPLERRSRSGGRPATSALRFLTGERVPRAWRLRSLVAVCAVVDSRVSASTIVGSETCQPRATSCEATVLQ